ncbi:unnamed protein product [Choristocarpus tenellus]
MESPNGEGASSNPVAGETVPEVPCGEPTAMPQHSWSRVAGNTFRVRMGPNYLRTKHKEPSGEALYELVAIDWYRSEARLERLGERISLPIVERGHPTVPSLFIINMQMPMEAPTVMRKKKVDGPTLHVVFYFAISEDTVKALEDPDSASSSIRLLQAYCSQAESDPTMRRRLKTVALLRNMSVLELPKFIHPYNGKPVLFTKSGLLTRGNCKREIKAKGTGSDVRACRGNGNEGTGQGQDKEIGGEGGHGGSFAPGSYLEMDVNVWRWSFLARKGLNHVRHKFGSMCISVAFLVEGRSDDEVRGYLCNSCE